MFSSEYLNAFFAQPYLLFEMLGFVFDLNIYNVLLSSEQGTALAVFAQLPWGYFLFFVSIEARKLPILLLKAMDYTTSLHASHKPLKKGRFVEF